MSRPVFSNSEERARPARLDRDRGLVDAARHDPACFDALYRKYLAQVYSYAFYELRDHHAAEDPADASTFRIWLFRIARNVVSNERRRDRRRPVASLEHATGLAAADDTFETAAAREAGSAAWQAVARLPEDRRRAVVLRFVDEMSTAEIAEVMGRSEGAIRVLLHRALRSLAADLRARLS